MKIEMSNTSKETKNDKNQEENKSPEPSLDY